MGERDGGENRVAAPLSGARRWLFPLAAATMIPAAILVLLEVGLRVAGTGYPTSFFVPVQGLDGGPSVKTTNPRFGWRFFPPAIARTPVVDLIPDPKEEGVFRIFVVGGSAALGTPDASYSFGRILEAMLRDAFPEGRFEVINAAMAALNSHGVRDIAREAVDFEADLLAVYVGNNEVVGPYGPGTVFQGFTPSLGAIRLGLWTKRTRIGQAAEALFHRRGRGPDLGEWKGLEMFQERRVGAADPRLEGVYDHFEANLRDIFEAGHRAGVPVLISTVAVNLKDNPPFASLHRPDLGTAERERWETLVDQGVSAASRYPADDELALESFSRALAIDDRHAGLRYRLGRTLLALGRPSEARAHLLAARDLDALRFHADGRINETIREVAKDHEENLVDGEKVLGDAASGLPGNELFWEHVHLRFEGNYLLARIFFERVADLLPADLVPISGAPPTLERCAELLALSEWDRYRMASTIERMTARPPFTVQMDHREAQSRRKEKVQTLAVISNLRPQRDESLYREALARDPEDLRLLDGFADFLHGESRHQEEREQIEAMLALVPGVLPWRTRLAFALADSGDLANAESELEAVRRERPDSPEPEINLATVIERRGDRERAEELYRRALALAPAHGTAHRNLASLLESSDRPGDAEAEYRRFLGLDPGQVEARNNLGFLLGREGREEEAITEYRRALRDDPAYPLAWFNLADALFSRGEAAEAVEAYGRGLEIDPENHQGRYNFAGALQTLERWAEAEAEFRRLLDVLPADAGTLNNLAWVLIQGSDSPSSPIEAEALTRRALAIAGREAPEILETLAEAQAARGNRRQALETLDRALARARNQGKAALAERLAGRRSRLIGVAEEGGR